MTATVGSKFMDASFRELYVEGVYPGDPLGREVIGTLSNGEPYATTLASFKEVWIDRQPPVSRAQQEANRKKLGA